LQIGQQTHAKLKHINQTGHAFKLQGLSSHVWDIIVVHPLRERRAGELPIYVAILSPCNNSF